MRTQNSYDIARTRSREKKISGGALRATSRGITTVPHRLSFPEIALSGAVSTDAPEHHRLATKSFASGVFGIFRSVRSSQINRDSSASCLALDLFAFDAPVSSW